MQKTRPASWRVCAIGGEFYVLGRRRSGRDAKASKPKAKAVGSGTGGGSGDGGKARMPIAVGFMPLAQVGTLSLK